MGYGFSKKRFFRNYESGSGFGGAATVGLILEAL